MKNTPEEINSRLENTKEQINDMGDRIMESPQVEQKITITVTTTIIIVQVKGSLEQHQVNKLLYYRSPRKWKEGGKSKQNKTNQTNKQTKKNLFVDIIAKKFPNTEKKIDNRNWEAQKVPKNMNPRRYTP